RRGGGGVVLPPKRLGKLRKTAGTISRRGAARGQRRAGGGGKRGAARGPGPSVPPRPAQQRRGGGGHLAGWVRGAPARAGEASPITATTRPPTRFAISRRSSTCSATSKSRAGSRACRLTSRKASCPA